jgi:hypothetical protein
VTGKRDRGDHAVYIAVALLAVVAIAYFVYVLNTHLYG